MLGFVRPNRERSCLESGWLGFWMTFPYECISLILTTLVYASPAYENEEEMSQILNLNSSLGPQSSDLTILTKFIHLNSAPGLCLPQALELKRRLCSNKDVL